jgi:polyisoprenoid-binding protein YceI
MSRQFNARTLWPAGWLAITALAMAADANVDAGRSTVIATFKQENVPVDAPFKKVSGHIDYDAAKAAAASATIEVDMASLDIGDEGYNAEVRKKPWFDTGTFPRASFHSTAIKPTTPGAFEATGTLSLKGKSTTIVVPVTVKTAAGTSTYSGSLTISRKAYGIGDPQWDDVLDDKVTIRFQLVAAGH